ncbi:MAG: hypothetical protein KC736_03125 [Candidatus Moranbacteria bacterium]|nr:hypothetical protein [Candidatus Moranbacteria bacterium]
MNTKETSTKTTLSNQWAYLFTIKYVIPTIRMLKKEFPHIITRETEDQLLKLLVKHTDETAKNFFKKRSKPKKKLGKKESENIIRLLETVIDKKILQWRKKTMNLYEGSKQEWKKTIQEIKTQEWEIGNPTSLDTPPESESGDTPPLVEFITNKAEHLKREREGEERDLSKILEKMNLSDQEWEYLERYLLFLNNEEIKEGETRERVEQRGKKIVRKIHDKSKRLGIVP